MAFFSKSKIQQAQIPGATLSSVGGSVAGFKKYTVLLVDDEATNLSVLSDLLGREYDVVIARDGQEALDFLLNDPHPERIHVIISDQRMPRLTGIEFLKKTVTIIPMTVRIVLTGFTDVDAIIDCINEGKVYQFMHKPVDPQNLLVTIKRALESYELEAKNTRLMQELQQTVQVFEKFVPNQFLRRIASEGIRNIQLGEAQSEILTVLFSDIREFTNLTESMSPQQVLDFLNTYFQCMNAPIHRFHGFIDKFIGDAIMALFDIPGANDHEEARYAVWAAIGMQEAIFEFNQKRAQQGYTEVQTGIGIHSGPVVIGTVGSKDRMDSTVLGDTVNVASRLEGLTKVYGAGIIISEETLNLLGKEAPFQYRALDWVRVKGRCASTMIYEIFDFQPQASWDLKKQSGLYLGAGVNFRRERRWAEALQAFQKALEIDPQDRAAQFHLKQCLQLQVTPLPEDWDGASLFT